MIKGCRLNNLLICAVPSFTEVTILNVYKQPELIAPAPFS